MMTKSQKKTERKEVNTKYGLDDSDDAFLVFFEAVGKAEDKGISSLTRIAIQFELLTGDVIQHQDLKDMLEQAEQVGLVFKSVFAIDDVPYLVWKSSPTRPRFNWLSK